MVLGDNLHSKVILLDVDVWIVAHCLHQSALNLRTGIIGVVKNAELAMAALTMEVELAVLLLVEVDSPLHQFLDLLWCLGYHLLYCLVVADIVTSDHCVLDMLVEVVHFEISY